MKSKSTHGLPGFETKEIESRLQDIFNGYLGCDTGDSPEELQTNHHLIMLVINHFKEADLIEVNSE